MKTKPEPADILTISASFDEIGYVTLCKVIHLGRGFYAPWLTPHDTLCGLPLLDSAKLTPIPDDEVVDLHTFTVCSGCSRTYLNGGYRDRLLGMRAKQAGQCWRAVRVDTQQMALF